MSCAAINETERAGKRVSSREGNGTDFSDGALELGPASRGSWTANPNCEHGDSVTFASGEAALLDLSGNVPPTAYSNCRIWPVLGS